MTKFTSDVMSVTHSRVCTLRDTPLPIITQRGHLTNTCGIKVADRVLSTEHGAHIRGADGLSELSTILFTCKMTAHGLGSQSLGERDGGQPGRKTMLGFEEL